MAWPTTLELQRAAATHRRPRNEEPAPHRCLSRGKTEAVFAVAHTMLMIAWHVIAEQKPYAELGVDYFTHRTDPEAHARASPSKSSASTSLFSRTPPPDRRRFLTAAAPWK